MLKELSLKDSYWRKIALNICKDKGLADDLVQAINWEDAERKTNQEIVGELIETIDEDTGEIINFENLN
jgi:hypothetical protein